jgi:Cupin domain
MSGRSQRRIDGHEAHARDPVRRRDVAGRLADHVPPIAVAAQGRRAQYGGRSRRNRSIVVYACVQSESDQEAFLVLSGECRLLVEGEERRLRPWDFFHCPSWTEHAFVGAGDGPCVILMAGARSADAQGRYPVSKLAARYGASVEEENFRRGRGRVGPAPGR